MLLDDAKIVAQLDKANVRASIDALPLQVAHGWRESTRVRVPASYQKIENIVVSGMGGSTLGAHIIQSVFSGTLSKPFSFVNDYRLPAYVGKNSLVILCSYSGTTEETLACFREAKKRKAKIMGITTGGPLASLLKRAKVPAYVFKPQHNPSAQPRLGLGYMIAGMLGLLNAVGVISVDAEEMESIPQELEKRMSSWRFEKPMQYNDAKLMAQGLHGTLPIIVSADHLVGNAHVFQNQVHETAKQFCAYFPIPELNHHLMEGLEYPPELHRIMTFVFVTSPLMQDRVLRRVKITQTVVAKQGYDFRTFEPAAETRLGQAFEMLAFSSAVSFYLAMLGRVVPSDIPWVNFFKKELSKT